MKVKDLLRALGDIDDKYLIEKYETIKERRSPKVDNNVKKVDFRKGKIITLGRGSLGVATIAILAVIIVSMSMINKREGEGQISDLIQIANPITEVESIEEMKKYLGFDVPVLEKNVEAYIVIGEDKYATHARIMYQDDTKFEMEKGNSDVSGIYGGIPEKEEIINNIKVQFYSFENTKYVIWSKNGYSYSYSNSNGEVSKTELEKLLK